MNEIGRTALENYKTVMTEVGRKTKRQISLHWQNKTGEKTEQHELEKKSEIGCSE